MKVVQFDEGIAIHGAFPDKDVRDLVAATAGPLHLTIADPPYGNIVDAYWDQVESDDKTFCAWMLAWTNVIAELSSPGSALYVWGGTGKFREGKKPPFRPFYRYLVDVELETPYNLATHITWSKKRAYGIQWSYLYTREELAYLVLGDPRKPRCFNVPLLETKRGYAGYSEKYPAKSEFYRRTNVWTDITEILRGKIHVNQKPEKLMEIPIAAHTQTGEFVFDPFAGSATTAVAARNLGRQFVVVERDAVEFDKLVSRLRGEKVTEEKSDVEQPVAIPAEQRGSEPQAG